MDGQKGFIMTKELDVKLGEDLITSSQSSDANTDLKSKTTSYKKLVDLIVRYFNVDHKIASLIVNSVLSIIGSVASIVTVVLSLLKGLGVI